MSSAGQAVGQHDGVGVPGYQGLLDEDDAWAGGVFNSLMSNKQST